MVYELSQSHRYPLAGPRVAPALSILDLGCSTRKSVLVAQQRPDTVMILLSTFVSASRLMTPVWITLAPLSSALLLP